MSEKLFYETRPLQCHSKLAHMIGLSHAIVFQQMKWLITEAPDHRVFKELSGQVFVEYTQDWLVNQQFPFMCERNLRRILDELCDMGLMLVTSYRKDGRIHNRYGISPNHHLMLTDKEYTKFTQSAATLGADAARENLKKYFKEESKKPTGNFSRCDESDPPATLANGVQKPEAKVSDKEDKINISKKKEEEASSFSVKIPPILDNQKFRDKWAEYCKYRSERKIGQLTPSSVQKNFNAYAQWGLDETIEALETSMMHGWKGVFKPKPQFQPKQQSYSRPEYREMPTAN